MSADIAQADLDFLTAMAEAIADPEAALKTLAGQDYVEFGQRAMGWWVALGNAGQPIAEPKDKPRHDRIILFWAKVFRVNTERVEAALAAQKP